MVVEKTYIAEKALQQEILSNLAEKATSAELAALTHLIRMDKYAPFILNPSYSNTMSGEQTLLEINGSGYLDRCAFSSGGTSNRLTVEIDGVVYAKFTSPNITDVNGFIQQSDVQILSESSVKYVFSNGRMLNIISPRTDFSAKFPTTSNISGAYIIPAGIPFKNSLKISVTASLSTLVDLDVNGVIKV